MSPFSDNVHDLANEAVPIINIPVVREDLTNNVPEINCNLPENKNNPNCNIVQDIDYSIFVVAIIGIIIYAIIIFGALKTKNETLKIFLIVSMVLPFLAPAGLILALLIITNAI